MKAIGLYEQGKSKREIASILGVSISTVRRYLSDIEEGPTREQVKIIEKLWGRVFAEPLPDLRKMTRKQASLLQSYLLAMLNAKKVYDSLCSLLKEKPMLKIISDPIVWELRQENRLLRRRLSELIREKNALVYALEKLTGGEVS